MHPVIENFLERPMSHKIGLGVVILALFAYIFWTYGYKTHWQTYEQISEKIETLETKVYEQQRIAKKLPEYKAEVAKLDGKLQIILRELPDSKEIENLLESISVLAIDTGLEVIKFAPARTQKREFVAEVPVEVEVEGTFHQLATFFDEVGHLARIVNINTIGIEILNETKTEVLIRSSFLLTTFRYLDESERLEVAQSQAAKKRGSKRRR